MANASRVRLRNRLMTETNTQPALRTDLPRKRIFLSGVVLFALVVTALLVPVPFKGRSASALGDLVHAPLFGSLALATLWAWQRWRPLEQSDSKLGRRLVFRGTVVWVSLSMFGLAMEVLQSLSGGRSGTLHDTVANSLGIAAAVCAYAGSWFLSKRRRAAGSVFLAAAVTLLGIGWYRPVRMLWDVMQVPRRFPLLASFESEIEFQRWYPRKSELTLSREHVSDGRRSLRVRFEPEEFTAITLFELPNDWSQAETLQVDVTLENSDDLKEVSLFIQIANERGSVSRLQRFLLRPGKTQRLEWAGLADEDIDLSEIRYVDLGIQDPTEPVTIFFDRLTLTLATEETSTD